MTSAASSASPSVAPVHDVLTVDEVDIPWLVIVWNDPINLMSYVTYIFQTLLGHPRPVAEKLMLDVHHRGRATVSHGGRDEMEAIVTQLQAAGLWATLAKAEDR